MHSMITIRLYWLTSAIVMISLCACPSSAITTSPKFQVGQAVITTSGTIFGHRAQNATQVSEYLGIPFAHPPIGDLRFAPPVAWRSNQTFRAEKYGHDCPSVSANISHSIKPASLYNILALLGQVGDNQHEDCLYVNVWSKPQSGSHKKPVLIWIYGGGYSTGGTNSSAYDGQFWADSEDVVFVNFNYRLNIFGFPGGPNMVKNVGLLDQRLAVEWVRDNIAAFGGDPSRIVIFGQSAGGGSVDLYNYAYTHDPIIAGSIAESGTAISFGNLRPQTAAQLWLDAAHKLGCNSRNYAAILACLRSPKVTMADLLRVEALVSQQSATGTKFNPTIDDKTVFENYTDLALQKRFIHKPYLFGNNYYEAGLFKVIAESSGTNLTAQQWLAFDAAEFTCPVTTSAIFRADIAKLPTWRYIYKAEFPNEFIPGSMGDAWHGAELLPMFGTSEAVTKQDSTWQERSLGRYLRGAWAAFAHDPEHGLNIYGWKQYRNRTTSIIQLGFAETGGTTYDVFPTYNSTAAYSTLCPDFPLAGIENQ